jgi:hypothetical protein
MSLTKPFEDARAALALGPGDIDPAALKRAYRRAVAEHPPDTDADAFRRVREAYELLRDPGPRAREMLLRPVPAVPPPAPPEATPPPPRGATAVALLRLVVMRARAAALVMPAPKPKARPKSAARAEAT